MDINAIILAAGRGSRMKSLDTEKSKVSFEILNKPIIKYVLDTVSELKPNRIVTIVGCGGECSKALVEDRSEIVWQREMLGTGHAVLQTEPILKNEKGMTLVCCGDTPLLRKESLSKLLSYHETNKDDLTVLTAVVPNPRGYGRILRDEIGCIKEIKEHADCNEEQKDIKEVNVGVYVFDNQLLMKYLHHIQNNNAQKELYLTDLVKIFKAHNCKCGAYILEDRDEMKGINDRCQLAEATKILKNRINQKHMMNGVTIIDPNNTYIGPEVKIGPDTIIYPNTHIYGNTEIGIGNEIGPDNYFVNMKIGDKNHIVKSYLFDSQIGDHNEIGPFAHLRGHCVIHNSSRIGNFVEFKNTEFKDGAKCAHLTYLGDSEIGSKTNIGCGTITANYDGKNKFRTTIGENVFVGSGTTIIAPLTVEDDSFIAAGSTINEDVHKDDFAIARARQVNKVGYAKKYKKK